MSIIPTKTFMNLDASKKERIITASINEFSLRSFNDSKLSNIIKEAKIPRGSFYQYFADKKDLYTYILDQIAQEKLKYIGPLMTNPKVLPFTTLFKEMYKAGALFALDNPKFVSLVSHLLNEKNDLYYEIMGTNLEMAQDFYVSIIDRDKALGKLDNNVDSMVLAELVINMTTNVSIQSIDSSGDKMDVDFMINKIDKMMYILEKGITGENHV